MEEHIQTILIFLISIVILFIFPVYIAYEKKDDVSYALVLNYTQEFVEKVTSKGYMTLDEYSEFREKLHTTGNMYDIEFEHEYTSIIPVVKYYNGNDVDGYTLVEIVSREKHDATVPVPAYPRQDETYDYAKEKFKTNYIYNVLVKKKIYVFNENDKFTVKVKNTNQTLATLMYSMVSFDSVTTRIFVRCGDVITDTKWFTEKIMTDYEIYNMQSAEIGNTASPKQLLTKVNYGKEIAITSTSGLGESITTNTLTDYIIECKAYPTAENKKIDYVGERQNPYQYKENNYNYFIWSGNQEGKLSVAIGLNGVVVHMRYNSYFVDTLLSYEGLITPNDKIEIVVNHIPHPDPSKYDVRYSLFINEERVSSTTEKALAPGAGWKWRPIIDSTTVLNPAFQQGATELETNIPDNINNIAGHEVVTIGGKDYYYKKYPSYCKTYSTKELP